MIKTKLAVILTGTTIVGGLVVASLNMGTTKDIDTKLDSNQATITQYQEAQDTLKEKYAELDEDAKLKIDLANGKINEKNTKIKALKTEIAKLNDKIKELEGSNSTEITNLQKEVETLKAQVTDLNSKVETLTAEKTELENSIKQIIDAATSEATSKVEEANAEIEKANAFLKKTDDRLGDINASAKPLQADELSKYTGKVSADIVDNDKENSFLTGISASIQDTYAAVNFTISEDIKIGLLNKGNVAVTFLDKDGKTIKRKDKTWAGFLNDAAGNKFSKGTENNANYSNDLTAGTYSTTLSTAADKSVASIKITVTNNLGTSESLTINR